MPKGVYSRTVYQRTEKQIRQILSIGRNTRFQKGHNVPKKWRENIGKARWKGGKRKSSNGYWYIYKPEHPNVYYLGYMKKANLVMEKKIGRLLTKNEIAHHINGIKDDDRPENLYLFPSRKGHKAYHQRLRSTYKKWRKKNH